MTGRHIAYEFMVHGVPVPQGSMNVYNGRIVPRNAIAEKCRDVMVPLTGGVEVTALFIMPKPKTVSRDEMSVRPDLDKLVRAALDGLTGAAFADDAQVTRLHARKQYGDPTGARFIIEGWRLNRNSVKQYLSEIVTALNAVKDCASL